MNKYISALCALIIGTLSLTSCLNSSDDSDITYYNDTAITAFNLTTVNRYVHTTSKSGKDSVYKKTLSSPVKFHIDQYKRVIYNTDSLNADCDLSHVLVTISAKNNGYVVIKSLISDTLFNYSSSDSLDFSQPREIRVYANDGSGYRAYQIVINKHQTTTGKLLWEKMATGSYPVDQEKKRWEEIVAANDQLGPFIGAGTKEAYAFNKDMSAIMVSKDGGTEWTAEVLDDDASLLPKESFAFVSCPFTTNEQTDYQILAGVTEEGQISCNVWRKVAEYAEGSEAGKWAYMPFEVYNRYKLPAMINFSLVYFHGNVLAIDSNWIRISRDGGVTWKTSEDLQLPVNDMISVEARTDDEGALWLKNKDTDEVWRGLLVEE